MDVIQPQRKLEPQTPEAYVTLRKHDVQLAKGNGQHAEKQKESANPAEGSAPNQQADHDRLNVGEWHTIKHVGFAGAEIAVALPEQRRKDEAKNHAENNRNEDSDL